MATVNPPFALQNAGATHTAEGDRNHVAALLARPRSFESLVPEGGVNINLGKGMAVRQTASPSMSIIVGSGMAYVPGNEGAKQGVYCCVNDGDVTLALATAHGTLPRIDIVVARISDSAYSGVSDLWELLVVTGTAASSPVEPALGNNFLRLAQVTVGAAVSSVDNTKISDKRAYLTATGGIHSVTSTTKPPVGNLPEGQGIWLRDTGQLQFKFNGAYVTRSTSNTIQSGTFNVTFTNKNSHLVNMTFPTTFSSIPKVFANINSTAGPTIRWSARVYNITTTSATVFLFYTGDATTQTDWVNTEVQWVAIT